jgi:undecaprenyl-diphosphatase
MARSSARGWRLAETLFLAAAVLAFLFCLVARGQGRLALSIRVDTTVENRFHTAFQSAGIGLLRAISFFGGSPFLAVATVAVAFYLVRIGAPRRLIAFLAAVVGAEIWVQVLKQVFRRARPDLFDPLTRAIGFSFPSGHSTLSAVFYGAVAGLAAASCRSKRCSARALFLGFFATALIGLSRIALGVHWPTDVLGGWSLGFGWLALVFGVAEARARTLRPAKE